MKKIAITQRLVENESYKEQRACLDVRWGQVFDKVDFLPIILPYDYDFKRFEFDGVILSGGNSLGHLEPNESNKKRDDFEIEIIDFAIENNIPLLGICRGMQIIAKYFNSTFKKVTGQVGTMDILQTNNKSRYFSSLENLKIINSYANYFIDELGEGLLASAVNKSGLIKIIEHKDKKILASMGHLERNVPFQKEELDFLKFFFDND